MEIAFMIISVILIALVLLQSGKAEDAANAFTGGDSSLFSNRKERGAELFISRLTMIVGILFFVLAILTSIF